LKQNDESGHRVLEDILDEVLSFNYRSLRTLRDIFLRPGDVARSFLSGDRDTYTPTMRVWFGVVSWMFLLSIVWGGFGALILRAASAGGHSLEAIMMAGGRDVGAVADTVSTMAGILSIPISSLLVTLGIYVLRRFRPSVSLITTVQCYFIPVTAVALSSVLVLLASSFEVRILNFAWLVHFAVLLAIGYPVVRAGFADGVTGAAIKTVVLAVSILAISVLSNMVTLSLSVLYALQTVPQVSG
jgi:hypothetical protein